MVVHMSKRVTDDNMAKIFSTRASPLLLTDELQTSLQRHYNKLVGQIEKLIRNGSGWAVYRIASISLNITK